MSAWFPDFPMMTAIQPLSEHEIGSPVATAKSAALAYRGGAKSDSNSNTARAVGCLHTITSPCSHVIQAST
jgi:hypothetical protein